MDRRHARSSIPEVSLGHYLDAVARRFGIDAIALTDEGGRVLAAAPAGARIDPDGDGDVYVHPLDLGDRTLTLASLGKRVPRVAEVARRAARILDELF